MEKWVTGRDQNVNSTVNVENIEKKGGTKRQKDQVNELWKRKWGADEEKKRIQKKVKVKGMGEMALLIKMPPRGSQTDILSLRWTPDRGRWRGRWK